MATLADSFLADLEDLSDDEPELPEEQPEEDVEDKIDDIETLNYDDLKRVAKLTSDAQYQDVVQRVREAVTNSDPMDLDAPRVGPLEDDPTYKLLVECNKLAVDIDNEIILIHNYIRDKYRPKFPELESLVLHAVDYARVVQRIGNETDLTLVNLDDLLPAATVMVVTVTATTTTGRPLTADALSKTMEACDMALQLNEEKSLILEFVEARMHRMSPNLSATCGSEVAARLMGVAGGLLSLSRMPACNIMVLGARRKILGGLSSSAVQPHQGFVYGSTIVQQTPPALRARAARLLANKCTLIARVDAYGQDPTGETGEKMRQEVVTKIEKWQEPPPAKTVKPLPCPDAEKKKRRGGKRFRKMRERYGMTDMRKAVNRMMFNKPEEEYIDGDEVVGLGVLGGKEGSGRLRMVARQQKLKLTAKSQKKYAKQLAGGMSTMKGGMSTVKSGLTSSLAFTPIQGFELENPNARASDIDSTRSGLESYFSEYSGFRSIKKL